MQNIEPLAPLLTDEDLDILQSMKDFWVEETEDTLKLIFVRLNLSCASSCLN